MQDEHQQPDEPYDAVADAWASVAVAFEVIRQRMAAGGPGWTPGATLNEQNKSRQPGITHVVGTPPEREVSSR